MSHGSNSECRRLFRQMVYGFAQRHPDQTPDGIRNRIAEIVDLSASSVEKWYAGYPIAEPHIPILAEWAVRDAGMQRSWLRSFLRRHSFFGKDLEEHLFGSTATFPDTSRDEGTPDFGDQHHCRFVPEPEYARLFGVDSLIQKLIGLLDDPDTPRLISIEGMGGIGKTVLAQAVVSRLVERGGLLRPACWVSARQEKITERGEVKSLDDPARSVDDIVARLAEQLLGPGQLAGLSTADKLKRLESFLSAASYLIVVDNLETVVDSQTLPPALWPLAGTTRFLFTSRHTLQYFPYVQVVRVPELSFADSYALVQSELSRRGQEDTVSEEMMDEIYSVVGGLPLALKLATAQIGRLPLNQILGGLQLVNRRAQKMYDYIYSRTWYLLDEPARKLLLSMIDISPDGENVRWLRLMSVLPDDEFDEALTQLLDYSLLEIARSLPNPIYRLHRLTVNFLSTRVLIG